MPDAPCSVAVDLTYLAPGGDNGGIKPAILAFLRTLQHSFADEFVFTFLTNSASHGELVPVARPQDRLVCILERADLGLSWATVDVSRPNATVEKGFQARRLVALRVDVLYCPFGPTDYAVPEIPTVAFVPDLLHRDYPYSIPEWQRRWREEYLQRLCLDAFLVHACSEYTVARLSACYPWLRGRLFHTYQPIADRLHAATAEAANPYFFYPANFWVHKNHEVLLLAYQLYRSWVGDAAWPLKLTGTENERARALRAMAAALRVERLVSFKGHVSEDRFAALWRDAGALVYPSLYEGFGIPLLEAMRFQKPILCGTYGSVPEVIGDAGLLIDAKDPVALAEGLRQLSSDATLRAALVEKGRNRLKGFDLEHEVGKLRSALLEAATRKPAGLMLLRQRVRRIERERQRWAAALKRRLKCVLDPLWSRRPVRLAGWPGYLKFRLRQAGARRPKGGRLSSPAQGGSPAPGRSGGARFALTDRPGRLPGAVALNVGIWVEPELISMFGRFQLWRHLAWYLGQEPGLTLCLAGPVPYRRGTPILVSRPLCLTSLNAVAHAHASFSSGFGRYSRGLTPLDSGGCDVLLIAGYAHPVPRVVPSVQLIHDLRHWQAPHTLSEATRLHWQASLTSALSETAGFLFASESIRADFSQLLPMWEAKDSRPSGVLRWPLLAGGLGSSPDAEKHWGFFIDSPSRMLLQQLGALHECYRRATPNPRPFRLYATADALSRVCTEAESHGSFCYEAWPFHPDYSLVDMRQSCFGAVRLGAQEPLHLFEQYAQASGAVLVHVSTPQNTASERAGGFDPWVQEVVGRLLAADRAPLPAREPALALAPAAGVAALLRAAGNGHPVRE